MSTVGSVCPSCGYKNTLDAKFCAECGAELSAGDLDSEATLRGIHVDPLDHGTTVRFEPPGTVIGERYELVTEIGRGGMGVVWKARDTRLDLDVAVKLLPEALKNDATAIRQLETEARLSMRLTHTGIVRLYQLEEAECGPYLIMELLRGPNLAHALSDRLTRGEGPVPPGKVLLWSRQALEALAYAHAQGVVHRDIKPHNLVLSETDIVKLTDFGIAHALSHSIARLTGSSLTGTPSYMSPEQLLNRETGPLSDIYSLGVTMYELLSGRPPFWRGDITYQHLHEQPVPMTGAAAPFSSVILRALEKDPAKRWPNARAFLQALESARPSVSTAAPVDAGTSEPHPKPITPRPEPPRGKASPDPRPTQPKRWSATGKLLTSKMKFVIIVMAIVLWSNVKKGCEETFPSDPVSTSSVVDPREPAMPKAHPLERVLPAKPDVQPLLSIEPVEVVAPIEKIIVEQAQNGVSDTETLEPEQNMEQEPPVRLVIDSDTSLVSKVSPVIPPVARKTLLNPEWLLNSTPESRAAAIDTAAQQLIRRLRGS
jgi:serine/threonine protein kinase